MSDAESTLDRSLELARTCGSRLVEGETLRVRATCFYRRGDTESARRELATAIGIFDELGAQEQRNEAIAWAQRVFGVEPTERQD
jgi:hypothetical protein